MSLETIYTFFPVKLFRFAEVRQKYQNFIKDEQKVSKGKYFLKGSGHQNFMNSFEYGKTLPDSSFQFQVNNWNHYPIQPLDIYKYKVACHRRSKRANKPLLRYVFPGWPQNFGRVAFSSSFPFASKRINNLCFHSGTSANKYF